MSHFLAGVGATLAFELIVAVGYLFWITSVLIDENEGDREC